MSNGLTLEHIEAFKARLQQTSRPTAAAADDLSRVGQRYWKDRALQAEARAERVEAKLQGVLAALEALGIPGVVDCDDPDAETV